MSDPWYRDGLRFKCTGCGECCTGSPGVVWISDVEIEALAQHLDLSKETFIQEYTHVLEGKRSLIEDPHTYDCVFLKERKCTVYQHRPKQCRTFPWWPENIKNRAAWNETGKRCEGVNHPDAPLISLGEIKKSLD
jgi:uncharacterized protein